MLHKKWIIVILLSTILWGETSETNITIISDVVKSINNVNIKKDNNESNHTDINNTIQKNIPVTLSNTPKDNEINTTKKPDIFESIINFFSKKKKNNNLEINNVDTNSTIQENVLQPINNKPKKTETNTTNTTKKNNLLDAISNFFSKKNKNNHLESNHTHINNIHADDDIFTEIKDQKNHRYLSKLNDLHHLNGTWHLRVMDGMDVRKARTILDFSFTKINAKIAGFDACNRIVGNLIKYSNNKIIIPNLIATKMACRQNIHRWTSTRLHELLKEEFYIKENKRYGIKGLTLKSPSHELFFKKMGRD